MEIKHTVNGAVVTDDGEEPKRLGRVTIEVGFLSTKITEFSGDGQRLVVVHLAHWTAILLGVAVAVWLIAKLFS